MWHIDIFLIVFENISRNISNDFVWEIIFDIYSILEQAILCIFNSIQYEN